MTNIIQNRIEQILYNDRDFSNQLKVSKPLQNQKRPLGITMTYFVLFRAMPRLSSRLISKILDISNQVKQFAMEPKIS